MMARALALNGAHKVYILGRRKAVLEAAAQSVSTGNIVPIVCDVTSKEALLSAVSTIKAETGYVNVVVANSGTAGPQATVPLTESSSIADFQKSWLDTPPEDYTKAFELNTTAAWYTIASFLELLDEGNKKGNAQNSQAIVTSSIGGFNRNIPAGFAYGQSKAAATHMVKQLATQLVPYSIRANAIAPGSKFFSFPYFQPPDRTII
jgi:NAD(P)-dependent dehydrogenase (short-subunit alcohol dehydrogenase family)